MRDPHGRSGGSIGRGLVLVALLCARCAQSGGNGAATRAGNGGGSKRGDVTASSTRQMAERLETLTKRTDPMDDTFRNAERADHLKEMLEGALDPRDYIDLQPRYATELLNSGRTEESIRAWRDLWTFFAAQPARFTRRRQTMIRHELAVAYLRLGEQENCQEHHNIESCLLPVRGAGVHGRPRGSRQALEVLTGQLKDFPDDREARWLYNIAAMTLGEYPDKVPPRWLIPPSAFASAADVPRFHDVAPALGLDVDDMAGGSIAEDFDGDGVLDLMISANGARSQLRLFHNNADGTFRETTGEAGLTGETGGLNLVRADYDNDGHPDVLVLRGGWQGKAGRVPNSLLRNRGDGTFEDTTEQAGLLSFHPTQTAVWFDYDGDGWLDLYIGNESTDDDPEPSELYHNDHGRFTECAERADVTSLGMVKAVVSADYDNDGRPDLYLSRRGQPNRLYHNGGPRPGRTDPCDWIFTDVAEQAGVTEPIWSFPAWFFDYDNDGWADLFVAGYHASNVGDFAADVLHLPHQAERARLYHNNHDGTFRDLSKQTHLDRLLHAMGSNFGDLDNDGWLDFYLGTGDPNLGTLIPNRMFRNAEGRFFQDVTTSGGFGHLQKGHGVSFADFDNDGDQDIYEVVGGVYEGDHYRNVLFENPGNGHHWVTLRLEGVRSNRDAVGARIRVEVSTPAGPRAIYRTVGTGGSFGCSPLRQEIGLGDATAIGAVTITWPASGIVQTLRDLQMDRFYTLREDQAQATPVTLPRFRLSQGT